MSTTRKYQSGTINYQTGLITYDHRKPQTTTSTSK